MYNSLKNYQEKAVNKLVDATKSRLNDSEISQTIIFKSPTGSGKTYMVTKYIERLVDEINEEVCFIWISIGSGDLHIQSYNSVKNILQGNPVCILLEDDFFGSRRFINSNEIVFVNWEKINSKDNVTHEWKNTIMRNKETNNFTDVLSNTRNLGIKIILIIDESHVANTTERAIEIRDEIVQPFLTIEMSATPVLTNYTYRIEVNPNDVISEGMMKKEIFINHGIKEDGIPLLDTDSQELVLNFAFQKRLELQKLFENEGSTVNPLVLIQIPNSDSGEDKLNFIEKFLEEKGVTYLNGKFAVWLSGKERNFSRDEIKINDNKIDFLVFKQAVATGWDCPRAHILVRFREIRTYVFETQTVGRILRMPEAKHYQSSLLNVGYVYTNLQSIVVRREIYNPNIIKSIQSVRSSDYKELKLTSYYRSRGGFYNDVDSSFHKVYEEHFREYFGFDLTDKYMYSLNLEKMKSFGIDCFDFSLTDSMLEETIMKSGDIDVNQLLETSQIHVRFSENDLFHAFESMIKSYLTGFAAARSMSPIKVAIAKCFSDYLDINPKSESGMRRIQGIFVRYSEVYGQILNSALKVFRELKEEDFRNNYLEKINDKWEIEAVRYYNAGTHMRKLSIKSLYQPLYIQSKVRNGEIVPDNELESNFIEFLDVCNEVEWFWQNGSEHMESNFGIKYNDGSTFQPDFIVKFKSGSIGIFDTKPVNYNVEDTRKKSDALSEYIETENMNGKKLFGGIVIQDRHNFYINTNPNKSYVDYSEDSSCWEKFDLIVGRI